MLHIFNHYGKNYAKSHRIDKNANTIKLFQDIYSKK